jgi:hypothetical protein
VDAGTIVIADEEERQRARRCLAVNGSFTYDASVRRAMVLGVSALYSHTAPLSTRTAHAQRSHNARATHTQVDDDDEVMAIARMYDGTVQSPDLLFENRARGCEVEDEDVRRLLAHHREFADSTYEEVCERRDSLRGRARNPSDAVGAQRKHVEAQRRGERSKFSPFFFFSVSV